MMKLLYVVLLVIVTAIVMGVVAALSAPSLKEECRKTNMVVMVRSVRTPIYDCGDINVSNR